MSGTAGELIHWRPNPGPQTFALSVAHAIRELCFGGARGGSKSETGRAWLGEPEYLGHPHYRALVVRKNVEDLDDWADKAARMYAPCGGRLIGRGSGSMMRFPSGAVWKLGHLKDQNAFSKYVGQEYQRVLVEEANLIPRERDFLTLIGSCRSSVPGLTPTVFLTCNPGNKGHSWIRARYRIPGDPYTESSWQDGDHKPKKAYQIPGEAPGRLMMFIPSLVEDTPQLMLNDPGYVAFLDNLPEPFRSAWRRGRWDIFTGQAFALLDGIHVINPLPIPLDAPIYMTFDWGIGKPFHVGWWWVDHNGDLFLFAEWYGCGPEPDTGLYVSDDQVAMGINEREEQLGICQRVTSRLCGSDCFAERPNVRDGGTVPSTSETFAKYGIQLQGGHDGPGSRHAKLVAMKSRLECLMDPDGKLVRPPHLRVYRSCKHFIRTLRSLVFSEEDPNDIDSDGEDHPYDGAGHLVLHRPMRAGQAGHQPKGGKGAAAAAARREAPPV